MPAILFIIAYLTKENNFVINNNKVKQKKVFIFFGVALIFLLTGFKGDIDPDYKNYLFYFDLIPPLSKLNDESLHQIKNQTSNVEFGMVYMMSFLKSLSLPFQSYYIFTSTVICFLSSKLAKSYPGNEAIVLFFLYCFYFQPYFIQTRYFISLLSILMVFSLYHRHGRLSLVACIYFFIGLSFHSVAIFVIPLLLASHFANFIKRYWIQLLLFPLFLVTINITDLIGYAGAINERYDSYTNGGVNKAGDISSFYIRFYLVCFLSFLCVSFTKFKFKELNKPYEELLILCFLMLCSWSIAWKLGMLYRVALIFEISWVFFIMYSNEYLNPVIRRTILFTLVLYAFYRLSTGVSELEEFYFFSADLF